VTEPDKPSENEPDSSTTEETDSVGTHDDAEVGWTSLDMGSSEQKRSEDWDSRDMGQASFIKALREWPTPAPSEESDTEDGD
jgi:hypothetical protein